MKPKTFVDRANFFSHILRLLVVICFIVYIVPSPEQINGAGYKYCLIFAALLNLTELGVQHGRPRMNHEYARELILNYRTHYLTVALMFLLHDPTFLVLIPLTLNEVGFIAHYIDATVRVANPARLERYDYAINHYLGPLLT